MQSTARVDREERLRLCFVGWADHVHVERWAGYFSRIGHDVTVLNHGERPGRYPAGVRQYRVGFESRSARWRQLRLRSLFWQLRPDVVHVHWAHFAHDVVQAWRGPVVVTAWGSDIYRQGDFAAATYERTLATLARVAAITCDSDDLANRIEAVVASAPGHVHVIQWGVDTDLFHPGGGDSGLRAALDLGDRPVVLSARNFTPLYNQETVVRAFRRVADVRPDTAFVFKDYHGDQEYRGKVLALADELGIGHSVRVMDAIPYEEMPSLYQLARVSVSVPFSDATPMSLLEAMACGSLPVCSDLPSVREWIVDGVNGYLVRPDDPDTLAARIVALLQADASGMMRENRRVVEERASQHVHMARALALYRAVLESPRHGTARATASA
jgi:glycosyltransferase involved in cell wall biosynthesis